MRHRFHRAYEQHPNATLFTIGAPIGAAVYLAARLAIPAENALLLLGALVLLLWVPTNVYTFVHIPRLTPDKAERAHARSTRLQILTNGAFVGACVAGGVTSLPL